MKKRITNIIVIAVVLVLICFIPFPDSDVNLWFYFEDIDETNIDNEELKIYYTTYDSPAVSESQTVYGKYDPENKRVSFKFPADIVDDVQLIRVDLPAEEQTIIINGVSVSSGGAIKKNLDPSRFIDNANIILLNDIKAYDAVTAKCRVYIATGNEDPYFVVGEPASTYIMGCQSHHYITKGIIMILFLLGLLAYRKIEW